MRKALIVLSVFIVFTGCKDDISTSRTEIIFDETEALMESTWTVQKITIKYGTDNPDEAVPLTQMEEINSGNELIGKINLNTDRIVDIVNASDEFYLNKLDGMYWGYEDGFLIFQYDTGGFGYHVQWYGSKSMRWYIQGTAIEGGSQSVEVIELLAE